MRDANSVSILLRATGGLQSTGLQQLTDSGGFTHSPRAARSCMSACGRRGRPGCSAPAGTLASASVSGHGC